MQPIRLFALDAEDLDVVSAHVQDAVGRIGDMAFLPRQKRFALIVNRFDWLSADPAGKPRAEFERRRAALHFERVLSVKARNLPMADPDRVVNLLAIRFEVGDAPAGTVELVFSGDAAIRLEVECVEARLSDLGPAWATRARPDHEADDATAGGSASQA